MRNRCTAQVWQFDASNAIVRLPDAVFTGATLSNTLPAQSITLFVLAPAVTPPPRPTLRAGSARTDGRFELWLEGAAGRRYFIEASAQFTDWSTISTNFLASNSAPILVPATNASAQFYRAVWRPRANLL